MAQAGAAARRGSSSGAVLTARGLAAFHPRYEELRRSPSPEALSALSEATTAWMRSGLQHALASQHSLVLDGAAFNSIDVALATAGLFAQSGFATHVSVIAVPRSESLLATASKYLLDTRAGRPAQFVTVSQHDAGLEYTRSIVRAVESTPAVDRLTILGRDGAVRFDHDRGDANGFGGASAALDQAHASPLPPAQTRRWLSELRATTDFALSRGQLPRPLADVLVELHQIAFASVVPTLPVPENSRARPVVEATLSAQLIAIRQAAQPERRTDAPTGPVIAPPAPDIGISR
ncbi:zeta toxin family protein [Microbacterium trichothecenolyticum]